MTRIVITGGGSGIGRSLASELANRGHAVLACGRRAAPLEDLRASHPNVSVLACDISTADGRQALLDEAQHRLGGVDVLINNAGVQEAQRYGEGSLNHEALAAEIQINLIAPMLLSDLFLPALKLGKEPAIVNVVSILAVTPKPNAPGYCASKAGLLGFTRSLRAQLADGPVKVIEVFPPLVDTPMTTGRGPSKMSSEEFAHKLADMLPGRPSSIVIGEASRVLFFARWMPFIADLLIRKIIAPTGASGKR